MTRTINYPGHTIVNYRDHSQELEIALREGWSLASEVVNAFRARDYEVLYKDEVGERVLDQLEAEARLHEAARG